MQLLCGNGLSQTHPMQLALQTLDKTHVIRIRFTADKVLFHPFQSEKQAREVLQGLSVKVLQMLEDVAAGGIAVDALAVAVKAGDREGADLELMHDTAVEFEVFVIGQDQIPAQGLEVAIANHKAVIILAHGQAPIGMQNQGQKGSVVAFEQTKLRTLAFQAKIPIIADHFHGRGGSFDFDDLLVLRPIQNFQDGAAVFAPKGLKQSTAFVGQVFFVLLPMRISEGRVKKRL